MIFIVQTCKPRAWRPLLQRLAEQHTAAGMGSEVNIGVQPDDKGEGQLRTMLAALRRTSEWNGGELRPVTLLEDDVEICEDFLPFVARRWREAGPFSSEVVQWYARGDLARKDYGPWQVEPGRTYLYNQATTFSPRFIGELFRSPRLMSFAREHRNDGDALIAGVLAELRWCYSIRVPGGAQHVGAESLVSPAANPLRREGRLKGGLVSTLYVGRDGRMGGAS